MLGTKQEYGSIKTNKEHVLERQTIIMFIQIIRPCLVTTNWNIMIVIFFVAIVVPILILILVVAGGGGWLRFLPFEDPR